jgi:hypothetical protein
MTVVDMRSELRELTVLQQRVAETQVEVRRRLYKLRQAGAPLKALSEATSLSEAQVSRLARQSELPETGLPALTASELVRRAQRGEIGHDDLVEWLMVWPFDPSYVTKGLADDWEWRDNSFDAVGEAYMGDLISDEEYERIVNRTRE